MSSAPGVEFRRAGRLENFHAIDLAVARPDGALVAACGDPHLRTYWRSAAKPFQLLPFVRAGGLEAHGFGAREIAVMAASHNGEQAHRDAAAAILRAGGLQEADLRCGAHLPENETAWRDLARRGGRPTPLWNNCSGKHAGMLAHCRLRGWPTEGYLERDHPLQQEILAVVAELTGEAREEIGLGVDGCGVPSFHLSLAGMARAYARLAAAGAGDPHAPDLRRIAEGVAAEPFFLAGTGRLCTRLLEVTRGRVIVKVGAAGVFCAALRERAWGLALKVRDGSGRAAGVALFAALEQLGAVRPEEARALAAYGPGEQRNHAGTAVGEARVTFDLASAGTPAA